MTKVITKTEVVLTADLKAALQRAKTELEYGSLNHSAARLAKDIGSDRETVRSLLGTFRRPQPDTADAGIVLAIFGRAFGRG